MTLGTTRSYNPPADALKRSCGREARSRAFRGILPRGRMESHPPSDEADLSAQEAASSKRARLPCPNEDHRWTPRAGRATRSRPQEADGLTADRGHNSPRLAMLSSPEDFAALQGHGSVRSNDLLVVRIRRTDLEATRFGFSTGRKLGGAVVRNRIRRRIREALRVMAPSFQPGWDVLIIARPPAIVADHQALMTALSNLLRRGGVLGGRPLR